MTELLHITDVGAWAAASTTGQYRMSTRGVTLEEQGFIHCSLRHQLRPVAEVLFGDAGEDLVVLVIDADRLRAPVRFEATGTGRGVRTSTSAAGYACSRIPDRRDATGGGGGGRLVLQ